MLSYIAAPGELNQLELDRVRDKVTIRDLGAPITAGDGCAQIDVNEVQGSPVDETAVFLGDRRDTATIDETGRRGFVTAFGEGGRDEVLACLTCDTQLSGGPADDDLVGNGSGFSTYGLREVPATTRSPAGPGRT